MSAESKKLAVDLVQAINGVIQGTEWSPSEGGVIADFLLVMIQVDGDGEYGTSWISAGSPEQAEGMANYVKRGIALEHNLRMRLEIVGDDDES